MEDEKIITWKKHSIISLEEDDMKAYLMLWPSAEEENATVEEIVKFLREKQIIYGIQEEEIERMLEEKLYLEEICVARGDDPIPGRDGEFEFFIEVQRERHPKIREDGSVDYADYDAVTVVKKDQLLVRYHPATCGTGGTNVKGVELQGRKGAEKPVIRGKGFYASEDKTEYYATFSGRAEYSNGYMVVSHVLEIAGDVDNTYGDIDFIGDVKIYGDIITRMTVKASGFITVEGHVEGAHLIAGKGVILKNGMQGNGIGQIDTTGEVEGRFFEQTTIHATGSLHANAILNCDIEVEGNVIVEGTMGALVAGKTRAGVLVQAAYIGNTVGITTKVIVGSEGNEAARIKKLQEELVEDERELYKSEGKIKILEEAIEKGINVDTVMKVKKELLRKKIVLAAEIKDKKTLCKKLGAVLEYSSGAQVIINKQAYPGTWVTVNGAYMRVPDVVKNITIKKKGEDACMFANV